MCELMTIAAAAVFTVWYFTSGRSGGNAKAIFSSMLMFWGAALMWSVDCVAGAMEGEPLLDLSADDALLGAIVLAAGLSAFGFLSLFRKRHEANAQ